MFQNISNLARHFELDLDCDLIVIWNMIWIGFMRMDSVCHLGDSYGMATIKPYRYLSTTSISHCQRLNLHSERSVK